MMLVVANVAAKMKRASVSEWSDLLGELGGDDARRVLGVRVSECDCGDRGGCGGCGGGGDGG